MSELLVGLGSVELVGIGDLGEGGPLEVVIRSRKARPMCEGCGGRVWSKGYRSVVLVDLPAFGRPVRLRWRKRRWMCPNPDCEVRSFIEQEPVLSELPSEHTFGDVGDRVARKGDVLLLTRGIERYTTVPCATVTFDLPAAFSNSLIRLRVDQTRLDPDYLRLYLTSRRGSAALAGAATGSVISNLRRDALQGVEIRLPDLATQKAVVAGITAIETHMAIIGDALKALVDLHDTVREGFMAGILGLGNHHAP